MIQNAIQSLAEKGYLPDALLRSGIRRLLRERLQEINASEIDSLAIHEHTFLSTMRDGPIACVPEQANTQHYEVPAAFFERVLGAQRKYSCAYWPAGVSDLDAAESAALDETAAHASLQDGQRILELGCGWGALTLYMGHRYPGSEIVAVSNSNSQRIAIEKRAQAAGLSNITVITADMNHFQTHERFDRIISVEMFEHMRNWEELLMKVESWMTPEAQMMIHIFVHRSTPYLFEDAGPGDWMSRHFFTGGMMPSAALPMLIQSPLAVSQRWFWSGKHYARTAKAWLDNMDASRDELWPVFQSTYGSKAELWWQRWRLFFMACEELFAYRGGQEWFVGHYQMTRR